MDRVYWKPGQPIWSRFSPDPGPDPQQRSRTVANTIHSCLDCRVLAGRYALRAVPSRDFAFLNDEDVLFTQHGLGKLFGESLSELLSGRCQSCCQRAAVSGLLSEWLLSESKSATKLLYLSVLVIYTARNHSKRQNYVIIRSDPKPSTANPEFQTRSHQSYPGDPNNPGNPRTNTEGKQGQTQKWKVEENHKLTNIHYIVILTNHSRP